MHVPRNDEELKAVSADTLRLTAYQYEMEQPGSDLAAVLSQAVPFATALKTAPAALAAVVAADSVAKKIN